MQHIFKSESLVNIRLTQIHEEVENLVENKKSVEPEKTKRVKTGKSSEGKENSGSRISRTNKKSLFFPQIKPRQRPIDTIYPKIRSTVIHEVQY